MNKEIDKELVESPKIFIEKVLQFGEGNFLRAFIVDFIDQLNEKELFDGSVVVVQPIPQGLAETINAQNGKYTVVLRGLVNGKLVVEKRRICSISRAINPYTDFDEYMRNMKNPNLRFVVSNTTEAGITYSDTCKLTDKPPVSFPAKITALLYERFNHFKGDPTKGFIFIPCELIDDSGTKLKEIVLRLATEWQLEEDFIKWVHDCNYFTNTLVDRIVTGYPKDEIESMELGYEDNLVVAGEVYHFFAIEVPNDYALRELHEKLPFHKAGLNIVLTNDVTPYKLRKVRILNGAHTSSVLAARLCGIETVGEMMKDPLFVKYIRKGIFDEIIPTLDLLHEDMIGFAEAVFDRFANPYIKHYLLSIALNSVAKYNTRVLSTIFDYYNKFKLLPEVLTLSFAALIAFYSTDEASDVDSVVDWFKNKWNKVNSEEIAISELVNDVCANTGFWDGKDLTKELPGFAEKVSEHLQNIKTKDSLAEGMRSELERVLTTVEA